ncbi:MAG: hypothetical protein AB1668_07480 [Nanoarchaeota archaeon]
MFFINRFLKKEQEGCFNRRPKVATPFTLHYDYPEVPATNNGAEQFFNQFRKVEDQRSFRRSEGKYSGRIGALAIEYNFSPLKSGCHEGQSRIEVSGVKLKKNILAQAIDFYMVGAP